MEISFSVLNLNNNKPKANCTERLVGDVWYWGSGKYMNKYDAYLREFFSEESFHASIIRSKTNYCRGRGLTANAHPELSAFLKKCNVHGNSFDQVFAKLIADWQLYGGYALQVVYNMDGTINGVYYIDISKLRWSADLTKLHYSEGWGKRNKISVTYDAYNGENTGTQVFYVTDDYTRGLYPTPLYGTALTDLESAVGIKNYYASIVRANFRGEILVKVTGPKFTKEVKKQIEDSLYEKFSGDTDNNIVVLFNENSGTTVEITPLADPDPEKKKFTILAAQIQSKIITVHQLTSASLVGVQTEGKLSLSSEYEEAFSIFKNVYVTPTVEAILAPIKKLFGEHFEGEFVYNPPAITRSVITDQNIIANNISTQELRELLQSQGIIKDATIPEGWISSTASQEANVGSAFASGAKKKMVEESVEEDIVVNEHLNNLTGKQMQNLQRILRKFKKKEIGEIEATIYLQSGFGFSKDEIKALLGIKDEQ